MAEQPSRLHLLCPQRRRTSKRTPTHLYNERPTWLDLAQRKLDETVFNAYGWPHDPSTSSGQAQGKL